MVVAYAVNDFETRLCLYRLLLVVVKKWKIHNENGRWRWIFFMNVARWWWWRSTTTTAGTLFLTNIIWEFSPHLQHNRSSITTTASHYAFISTFPEHKSVGFWYVFFGEEAELRRREIVSVSVFLLLRVFVLNLYNMCAYYFSCFFLVAVLLFFGEEERENSRSISCCKGGGKEGFFGLSLINLKWPAVY